MAVFHDRLRALGFEDYEAYLSSQHWKDFKCTYRQSGRPMCCEVCGGKPIQLHHTTYARLGEELLQDVTPLCREHHKSVHDWLKSRGSMVNATHKAIAFLKTPNQEMPSLPVSDEMKSNKQRMAEQKRLESEKSKPRCKGLRGKEATKFHCGCIAKKILRSCKKEEAGELSATLDGLVEVGDMRSIEIIRSRVLGIPLLKPNEPKKKSKKKSKKNNTRRGGSRICYAAFEESKRRHKMKIWKEFQNRKASDEK